MSLTRKQFNFNVVIYVLLGIIYNKVDIILAHQCYVCGPEEILSCDKFDPSNKSFIKDCPSAKACSIRRPLWTYDNLVERSCEDLQLQDCQIANNIKYCYCSEDLCNGKTIHYTDDEDLTEEGSGIFVIKTDNQNEIKNKTNTTNQSNYIVLYSYNFYFSILALLCT